MAPQLATIKTAGYRDIPVGGVNDLARGGTVGGRDTEVAEINESLRKSEAQLRTIVESVTEGLAVSDLNGQLLHFNRAALDLHGFATLEECRRHLSDFANIFELCNLDGSVIPLEQWPLARILGGENLRGMEVRIRNLRAGWQRVFSYGGTLVNDDEQKPLMAVVTISDITERKRDEERIAEMTAHLEQRVAERTAQLQAANEELEAFSYSVSHDLSAPLRAITGFAEIVCEDYGPQLDEEGQRLLGVIQQNAKRMGLLIDDLLSFSRFSKTDLNCVSVDMRELVSWAIADVQRDTVTPGTAEIVVNDLPRAYGDATLLLQVWMNLISNAVKYSRVREHPRVEIGVRDVTPASCTYYVRDNGVGFDMKYADKLFGVFQRLHRRDEFEGTGVGLAIVQRIVRRHDGRVWAESKPNEGASFYFTLPLRDV